MRSQPIFAKKTAIWWSGMATSETEDDVEDQPRDMFRFSEKNALSAAPIAQMIARVMNAKPPARGAAVRKVSCCDLSEPTSTTTVSNGCGDGRLATSSSSFVPPLQKQSIAITATTRVTTTTTTAKPSTVAKDTVRKAHVPKFMQTSNTPSKLLAPLEPTNRKVPFQLRQRHLFTIHAEYVKLFGDDDPSRSIEEAQNEEKTVLDRCTDEMGYLAAIPMLIKRLREAAANDQGVAGTSAANGEDAMADEDVQMETENNAGGGKTLVEIRHSELDAGKSRIPFVDDSVLSRVCDRCGKEYRLTSEGDYATGASSDQCIFHWGRAWKKRVSGTIESRYNCCDQPLTVQGCDVAPHHITQTQRLSTLQNYAETPRPFSTEDARSKKVYALDCEMVYTVWGPEVARLSVVDFAGALILDLIIRPEHRIVDCKTKFSGLKPEQVMAGECDLNEARQRFFELANAETILIGHSLESDLRAMRLIHRRVVDTSVVFPHRMGLPFKSALKTLASEIAQMIIQGDEYVHDSKEDAMACMRIMLCACRIVGDSVSHTSVLLGRHAKTVTCGLHRAGRTTTDTNFSETDFYNALQAEYLLTDKQMWDNGYPRWVAGTSAANGGDAMADEDMRMETENNAGGGKLKRKVGQGKRKREQKKKAKMVQKNDAI